MSRSARALSCALSRVLSCALALACVTLTACYTPPELNPSETCHPKDPACAALDFDGDGAPNGVDDFPLDPACATQGPLHCAACGHACAPTERCLEGVCAPTPAEVCDGLDNDGDARLDEGLSAPRAGLWRGVCAGLTQVCGGEVGWGAPRYDHISGYEPEEAACDGLDNDCDGLTDERLSPPLSAEQRGVCAGARLECAGAAGWVPPNLLARDGYEGDERTCDGLDNDCDGEVDEGLSGRSCATERAGRCAAGSSRCDGLALTCEPLTPPRDERCDGLDDDCDGVVDEGLSPPPVPGARGVCATRPQRCDGEAGWTPAPAELAAAYEPDERACDGLDNDCDGLTDEGPLSRGACEVEGALGECARGERRCGAGGEACAPLSGPSPELCDGLDNDCDGGVDEALGLSAPLSPEQRGVCAGARALCEGGRGWVPLPLSRVAAYEPQELTCDNLDNDCDGLTDEGLGGGACEGGGVGLCREGVERCVGGRRYCGAPEPRAEVCDGLDSDCDGAVDESLTPPSSALSQGVCAGRAQVCRGAQGWQDPPPTSPAYEPASQGGERACDGLDNDCDGLTDEALPAPLALEQRGVCAGATRVCAGVAGWREPPLPSPSPRYEPAELTCDGLDNDCDGLTDEGGAGADDATPCLTDLPGACAQGEWRCVEGARACVPLSPPAPERCDGRDDDCDGLTDEVGGPGRGGLGGDSPLGGDPCAVGVGACLNSATTRCLPTGDGGFALRCDGEPLPPRDERCDGVDNDCDGVTDEGAGAVGLTCAAGVGACRRAGVWRCEGGALRCDALPSPPALERCDDLDNDCDGLTDEAFFQLGGQCVAGVGQCEVRGLWACDAFGGITCGAGPRAPTTELCDGLDNDCDGRSDEHARPERCDGLDNDCDAAIDEALGPEVCDGADNDCDSAIDESPCAPCATPSLNLCPTLTWSRLPAGDFLMGGDTPDAQPARVVTLRAFELSQEVTVAQYASCVAAGACSEALTGGDCNAGRPERAQHPINCVTWGQATDFAYWTGARLPSEAQWEYAARAAGRAQPAPWGAASPSCAYARLWDASGLGCGELSSAPVCDARYAAGRSPQGVCDLIGNVSEWLWDTYSDGYEGAPLTEAPRCGVGGCAPEGEKVVRGGGWRAPVGAVGAGVRGRAIYSLRLSDLGFRVVRFGD